MNIDNGMTLNPIKRVLLITACAVVALATAARLLPEDGQRQWRWSIDATMPGDYPEGELIDLSDAPVTEAYETHYRVYGDTLVCRSLPGMRDWFVLRDSSLWTVGANDRVTRHAYSRGVPYLPPYLALSVRRTTDSLTVSAIDSRPSTLAVSSTLSVSPGPGFILAAGDTVPRTVEVRELSIRTDSAGATVTLSDRRWYADGLMFPVVEEWGIVAGDGLYATLTICPPSEQPHPGGAESRGGGVFRASPRPYVEECVDIVRHGDMLTAGSHPDDTSISVCDIQGRLMRTGTGSVSTGGLPPGWYIITVSGASGETPVKFRID